MFEKIDVQLNAKDLHNTIGRVLGKSKKENQVFITWILKL